MENKSGKTQPTAEEFPVEEFNVHDELENKLRTSMQNVKKSSSNSGTGSRSLSQVPDSPIQTKNFQYSSLSSNGGQKGYLTPQQQHVKSKISDIELL